MKNIHEIEQAIQNDPDNSELYFELAGACISSGKLKGAVQALQKASALSPDRTDYLFLLAETYIALKEYIDAKKTLLHVLSANPHNAEAHKRVGILFEQYLKDTSRANMHFKRYAALGGDDPKIIEKISKFSKTQEEPSGEENSDQDEKSAERNKANKAEDVSEPREEIDWLSWGGAISEYVNRNKDKIAKFLTGFGMFVVVAAYMEAFPVSTFLFRLSISAAIAGIAYLNPALSVLSGIGVLFFPLAFYSPILGYLYCFCAFMVAIAFLIDSPLKTVAILLIPLLLKMNLIFVYPLVFGIIYGAGAGAFYGFSASLLSACSLTALGQNACGGIGLNFTAPAIILKHHTIEEYAKFADFSWLDSMFSQGVETDFIFFSNAMFPSVFKPPVFLIQAVAFAFAGYAAGKFYNKEKNSTIIKALGVAAFIFFLESEIIDNIPSLNFSVLGATAVGVIFSSIIAILLAALKIKVEEPVAENAAPKETSGIKKLIIEKPKSSKGILKQAKGGGWEMIGGLDDVKKEIKTATRYVFDKRSHTLAKKYGLKSVKGILFYGPPGCGKTLFAKALCRELRANFINVSGSDFRSKWYGEAEKNLSEIFSEARANPPAIIFFDEIDNMLGKRGETLTSDSPEKRVVAVFLSEMDGVKDLGDVLVLGATNEPDLIDPAALRPGRFDKLIYIPLPDEKAREQIFRIHLSRKPVSDDIDYGKLTSISERYSGADIADICAKVSEQAAEESLHSGEEIKITMKSLEEQIRRSKPSVSLKTLKKYDELQEKYNRRSFDSEAKSPIAKPEFGWEDVGGLEPVKKELLEAIETPLAKPELYKKFNIKPPKGILLYGPPGCGKTLLAKVVALRCQAHFLSVDLKQINAEEIKDWFIRARENKPCVLFFDEIDSIAASRDLMSIQGHPVITQLLVELDGMEDLNKVIVVAATNRPDQIDGALMRPGRLDRLIYIPPPDLESRLQILMIGLKDKPLFDDVDIWHIADKTEGYSGADLNALCYEAAMNLIRRANEPDPKISKEDFDFALKKIKPSITKEELVYFSEMKLRYSRG